MRHYLGSGFLSLQVIRAVVEIQRVQGLFYDLPIEQGITFSQCYRAGSVCARTSGQEDMLPYGRQMVTVGTPTVSVCDDRVLATG